MSSRSSSPYPRSDSSESSLHDEIFEILFDKVKFFDKTNSFSFFFPNTDFPKLSKVNNRIEVPHFDSFVRAFCKRILSILAQNKFRLATLPSPVVQYAIRFLNRFFMYLYKNSKQQLKLTEKKKTIKLAKKKAFWLPKLEELQKNIKKNKEKFIASKVDELTSMSSASSDADPIFKVDEKKKIEIKTPMKSPLKNMILKKIMQIKFSDNYDSVVRLNFRFREILGFGDYHNLWNNDIYYRCSKHYHECSCPPKINLLRLKLHIELRKKIKSLIAFFPITYVLFSYRRDVYTGTSRLSNYPKYRFETMEDFLSFYPERISFENCFFTRPSQPFDFPYQTEECIRSSLSSFLF